MHRSRPWLTADLLERWGARSLLLLELVVLPLLFVSCSSCSGDPREAGFFCGVSNIASGTYEKRQRELTRQATQSEMFAGMRQEQLQTLQRQDAALLQEQSRLEADLASLRAALQREQAALRSASGERDADVGRLNALSDKLRGMQMKEQQVNQDPKEKQLSDAQLQQQIEEMQKEVDEIKRRRAEF